MRCGVKERVGDFVELLPQSVTQDIEVEKSKSNIRDFFGPKTIRAYKNGSDT